MNVCIPEVLNFSNNKSYWRVKRFTIKMHQKETHTHTHTKQQQHGNIECLKPFMLLTFSSITCETHFWLGYIHANKLLFDPSKKNRWSNKQQQRNRRTPAWQFLPNCRSTFHFDFTRICKSRLVHCFEIPLKPNMQKLRKI